MDSEKASDIANSFCEKWSEMAPSARWLNLTRLLEAYAESRVREALTERLVMPIDEVHAEQLAHDHHTYAEGYKAGQEVMRGRACRTIEEDFLLSADEFDAKTKLKVFVAINRVFVKVRSLPIEEKA